MQTSNRIKLPQTDKENLHLKKKPIEKTILKDERMNTFLPEIGNDQRMPTLTTSIQPYTGNPSKCNRVNTHTHTHTHTLIYTD